MMVLKEMIPIENPSLQRIPKIKRKRESLKDVGHAHQTLEWPPSSHPICKPLREMRIKRQEMDFKTRCYLGSHKSIHFFPPSETYMIVLPEENCYEYFMHN